MATKAKIVMFGGLVLVLAVFGWVRSPAEAERDAPGGEPAVTVKQVPGEATKRVALSARAAERLGIETGKVSEAPIVVTQMVGGLVVPPLAQKSAPNASVGAGGFGGFTLTPATLAPLKGSANASAGASAAPGGEAWVMVMLSPAEWERLAKDKSARILPLGAKDGKEVQAKLADMPPQEDSRRSMLSAYFVLPDDHGWAVNKRTRVALQLSGSDAAQKVVPYGALYYGPKGDAWVYVNSEPLAFQRQPVTVQRIVGDLAVLSQGPEVGTPIVTVGAALLFGTEIFGK